LRANRAGGKLSVLSSRLKRFDLQGAFPCARYAPADERAIAQLMGIGVNSRSAVPTAPPVPAHSP